MVVFGQVMYRLVKSYAISISLSLEVYKLTKLINYCSFQPPLVSRWPGSIPIYGCTVHVQYGYGTNTALTHTHTS